MGEKGEQTKAFIRKQAYHLFVEKGFSAVTMKDICDVCELSRGGLYRHYGSVQEIFEEILSELASMDEDCILTKIEEGIPANEILDCELARMENEMKDENTSLSYAMYEYSHDCNHEFMKCLNQNTNNRWLKLIMYGQNTGAFKKDVDAQQITDLILYSYQGIRMWSRVIKIEPKTVENIIQKMKQDLER